MKGRQTTQQGPEIIRRRMIADGKIWHCGVMAINNSRDGEEREEENTK